MDFNRMATQDRRSKKIGSSSALGVGELEPKAAVLREFIADFNAAGSLMRKLRRSLADSLDLTATEYAVMVGLWYCQRRGGETSVKDLADHLHVAAAHVTAELGKLLKRKLVHKAPSSTDKRALSVQLTDRGHEVLNGLAPRLGRINHALFAGVNYGEMVVVHQFLKRIVQQAPEAIFLAGNGISSSTDDEE
jgi:MarR family transcriptional regulator, organic hydroperoxide resistance regulator